MAPIQIPKNEFMKIHNTVARQFDRNLHKNKVFFLHFKVSILVYSYEIYKLRSEN